MSLEIAAWLDQKSDDVWTLQQLQCTKKEVPTYNVIFNNADYTSTEITKVITYPATTLDMFPTDPVRTGYVFGGWYTAVEGGAEFIITTPVTSDIRLFAHWTAQVGPINHGWPL